MIFLKKVASKLHCIMNCTVCFQKSNPGKYRGKKFVCRECYKQKKEVGLKQTVNIQEERIMSLVLELREKHVLVNELYKQLGCVEYDRDVYKEDYEFYKKESLFAEEHYSKKIELLEKENKELKKENKKFEEEREKYSDPFLCALKYCG